VPQVAVRDVAVAHPVARPVALRLVDRLPVVAVDAVLR
jgi:hypothetical protein